MSKLVKLGLLLMAMFAMFVKPVLAALDCNGDGTPTNTANITTPEGAIVCIGEMAQVAFSKGWVFFVAVITILLSIGLLGMGWRRFRGWLSGLSR